MFCLRVVLCIFLRILSADIYIILTNLSVNFCIFLSADFSVFLNAEFHIFLSVDLYVFVSGVVIAAWGDEGAAAAVQSISGQVDEVISVPAHCPPQVVDTLGAGDTFNAACIHTLVSDNSLKMSGSNLKTVLSFACKVAGEKCGMQGLEQLKHCHFRMQ